MGQKTLVLREVKKSGKAIPQPCQNRFDLTNQHHLCHGKCAMIDELWTCKFEVRHYSPVTMQGFFKAVTGSVVLKKAEHVLVMGGGCTRRRPAASSTKLGHMDQPRGFSNVPSPKPKQGIKLSSSKGDKVRPMMEIACSYGFIIGEGSSECRLRPLNECLPAADDPHIHCCEHWSSHVALTVGLERNNNLSTRQADLSTHCFS